MHGTRVTSRLTRRNFILTGATAAGGLMIGIGAGSAQRSRRHRDGATVE